MRGCSSTARPSRLTRPTIGVRMRPGARRRRDGSRSRRSREIATAADGRIIGWPAGVEEATIRIGIDARLADYTVGGIARYTTQLLAALRRLRTDHRLMAIRARSPKV